MDSDILVQSLNSSDSLSSSFGNNNKEYKFEVLWGVHKQGMRFIHGLSDRRRCLRGLACVQYCFSMESNIDDKNSRFKIFLSLEFPESKNISVDYHIRVGSAGYSKHCHHFFAKSGKKGDEVFHRNQVFETRNKFMDSALVNIKINGSFKVKEASSIVPFFFKPDYRILVDGQKLEIHKAIVQQHLPKFYSTFDLLKNKHKATTFSFMVLKVACGFCYDQTLPSPLFSATLIELIKFGETFENEKLKAMAESELCKNITNSNAVELANLTEAHNLPKLRQQALEYLASNFNEETIDFEALKNSIKIELPNFRSNP